MIRGSASRTLSRCSLYLFTVSVLLALQACGFVGEMLPGSENAKEITTEAGRSLVQVGGEDLSPFTLSVVDELYDGDLLHVQGRIAVKTDWQIGNAALRLRGIRNGTVVEEETVPVEEIAVSSIQNSGGKSLPAGAELETVLSIDASDITDYQLEMVWGEEEGEEPAVMAALVLRDLETRKNLLCSAVPCQIAYGMRGTLYNAGKATVSEAELGIGYVFVEKGASLDLSDAIPENEELLRIPGLNLGPGGSKPFTLKLSETVPERTDGTFVPVIRVVSYQ